MGSGSEAGFEHRITVVVDSAGTVAGATSAKCSGGAFSGAEPVGVTASKIAIVSSGANLLGQLELSIPLQSVGATPNSRIVVASDGDYINRLSTAITLIFDGEGNWR